MENDAIVSRPVFLAYEPGQSSKGSTVGKSAALSHAAAISWQRRLQQKRKKAQSTAQSGRKQPRSKVAGVQNRTRATDRPLLETHGFLPHPSALPSALIHGNNDPFDCGAVPITAEVNGLIAFWRDHVFRAARDCRSVTHEVVEGMIRSDLLGLRDSVSAEAFLLSASTVKKVYTRRDEFLLTPEELRRKQQAIALLRRAIDDANDDFTAILRTISSMYCAAMFSRQFEEAEMHQTQWERLMESVSNSDAGRKTVVEPMYLRFFVFGMNSAVFCSDPAVAERHTIRHVETILLPFAQWAECQASLGPLVPHGRSEMMLKNEDALRCIRTAVRRQRGEDTSSLQPWSLNDFFIRVTQALAFSRVARRRATKQLDSPTLPSATDAVVLCTIFVICTTTVFSTKNGRASQSMTDRMRAASVMKSHRRCLSAALLCQDPSYEDKCAMLWALYVGAAWEIRVELIGTGEVEWQPWYQAHLSQQVVEMGIADWSCFVEIVGSFCRIESVSSAETRTEDIICAGFDVGDAARGAALPSVTSELQRALFPRRD
jgi:hypothetical protein